VFSGWITRHQFEETWMSLLGVLNHDTAKHEVSPEVRNLLVYNNMYPSSVQQYVTF